MKCLSVSDDSFTKKFLINISSNFCKRHDNRNWPLFVLFVNLYLTEYFHRFWKGEGGGSDWTSGGHMMQGHELEKYRSHNKLMKCQNIILRKIFNEN